MSCIRGMGKMTLYVTNTIFMLLSIALVALGGYVLRSDWKDFFKPQFVYAIIAGGAFMMIMSCLGCAGARTQKKRFLCPYATVIFMCLCAQLAGAALALNFKGAMDKAKSEGFNSTKFDSATQTAYDYLETQWSVAFVAGGCDFITPSTTAGQFWMTTCTVEDGKYLQTFMNTKCNDDADSYNSCVTSTAGETDANKAFCNCRGAIVDKVEDALGPVTKIAIAAAAFEFFLVIASCALMCQNRKGEVPSQDTTQPLSANQYGQPPHQQQQQQQQQQGAAVPANGANMV